jgi:hypothetical protein
VFDLVPLASPVAGALTTAEIGSALGYAAAEQTPLTRQGYARDWRAYSWPGVRPVMRARSQLMLASGGVLVRDG